MPRNTGKRRKKKSLEMTQRSRTSEIDLTGSITFCPSASRSLEPFEVKACWLHYPHQFMFQATKGIPPRYTQSIRECPLNLPNKSTTTHLTQLHLMHQITYHNKTKRPKNLLFVITSKEEEPNGTESCATMLGQHLL